MYSYVSVFINERYLLLLINLAFGLMTITIDARHVKFCTEMDHLYAYPLYMKVLFVMYYYPVMMQKF